jgi:Ca2+-binding EF-hand superfamily protein
MNSHHDPLLFIVVSALLLSSPFKVTDLLAAPSQNSLGSETMVQPGSRVFSVHDIDKNGSISREEYRHFVEQIEIRQRATGRPMRRYSQPLRFEVIDSNDNGYLTEDEMISALNKRLKKHRRYRYRGGRW